MSKKTIEEMYDEAFGAMAGWEKEIDDHNNEVLKSIGKNAKRSFFKVLDYAEVTGKIEIVSEPKGQNNHEKYGIFKKVYCDQWGVGMEGDSWEGNLYAQFDKNKWLKIPYKC